MDEKEVEEFTSRVWPEDKPKKAFDFKKVLGDDVPKSKPGKKKRRTQKG
jgi:hypothetical protein|tara:strand:- start:323 stop:469 length:147 start_codon:yes stop_codon:yes gene_type:complete